MPRIEIALSPHDARDGEPVTFQAFDVPTALLIADINGSLGDAELWREGKRLARLTRRGGAHACFWEVRAG
ncbi:hypothetical protein KUW15_04065 [Qipengyuania aquimaris]|uniref:hypothetical protein n=1 Tax=Qipengyuania aquimaris TaxID=255984 RepID=UPI001C95CDC6|nr:hypothetical protein [Qipengyuania aquimaris]MBY6127885.1 hypothetical protein [Qipengyuania aquimaris]